MPRAAERQSPCTGTMEPVLGAWEGQPPEPVSPGACAQQREAAAVGRLQTAARGKPARQPGSSSHKRSNELNKNSKKPTQNFPFKKKLRFQFLSRNLSTSTTLIRFSDLHTVIICLKDIPYLFPHYHFLFCINCCYVELSLSFLLRQLSIYQFYLNYHRKIYFPYKNNWLS